MSFEQKLVWPLGGHAPGDYTCRCVKCSAWFMGDKRATWCLDCAIIWANKEISRLSTLTAAKPVRVTDEMVERACGAHWKDFFECETVKRRAYLDNMRAALTAALSQEHVAGESEAEAVKGEHGHSPELKAGLESVVKSLKSRPVELRGPFKSSLTEPPTSELPESAQLEVVAHIQREALDELLKHRDVSTTVASGLVAKPFGDVVSLVTLEAAQKAIADRDERVHYAEGVADLAMRHRDAAEARVAELEKAMEWYGSLPKQWEIKSNNLAYGDCHTLGERARATLNTSRGTSND